MRATEYIAANENSIRHLARIRTVLSDLRPLRSDKQATDRYCNEHLFCAAALPADTAVEFRHQLFEVIKDDPTYGYLMHNLALERNRIASFYNAAPVQCVPDDREIRAAISASRDDYPKATLDDYLEDDFNYAFYSDNRLTGSSADILTIFNSKPPVTCVIETCKKYRNFAFKNFQDYDEQRRSSADNELLQGEWSDVQGQA